jgi:hypothetical protein
MTYSTTTAATPVVDSRLAEPFATVADWRVASPAYAKEATR